MGGDHGEDDVVLVFFEFEDELDAFELVEDAEIDRGGGTEEIHGFGGGTGPGINFLEVKASFFLLQKYSHCAAYTALTALIHRTCPMFSRKALSSRSEMDRQSIGGSREGRQWEMRKTKTPNSSRRTAGETPNLKLQKESKHLRAFRAR
jgi:hypothetical protein